MNATAQNVASRIVDRFLQEHPDLRTAVRADVLQRELVRVYEEVKQGTHMARSDEELESRSRQAGIERKDLEALINITAHAATDQ